MDSVSTMAEMSGDRCGGGSKSSVDVRPKEGTIPKARSSENLSKLFLDCSKQQNKRVTRLRYPAEV